MQPKLVVVGGDAKATEIRLKLPTIIGRGREVGVTLPHPLVSRQHCEIVESNGQLLVRDLGSLNGTFVGKERINGEALLPPGELLTVGTVTFRAVYELQADIGAPAGVMDDTLDNHPGPVVEPPAATIRATTLSTPPDESTEMVPPFPTPPDESTEMVPPSVVGAGVPADLGEDVEEIEFELAEDPDTDDDEAGTPFPPGIAAPSVVPNELPRPNLSETPPITAPMPAVSPPFDPPDAPAVGVAGLETPASEAADIVEVDVVEVDAVEVDAVEVDAVEVDAVEVDDVEFADVEEAAVDQVDFAAVHGEGALGNAAVDNVAVGNADVDADRLDDIDEVEVVDSSPNLDPPLSPDQDALEVEEVEPLPEQGGVAEVSGGELKPKAGSESPNGDGQKDDHLNFNQLEAVLAKDAGEETEEGDSTSPADDDDELNAFLNGLG